MTRLQKLPKNVGDLGNLIVAKGFESCPKSNKSPNLVSIGINGPKLKNNLTIWSHWLGHSNLSEAPLYRNANAYIAVYPTSKALLLKCHPLWQKSFAVLVPGQWSRHRHGQQPEAIGSLLPEPGTDVSGPNMSILHVCRPCHSGKTQRLCQIQCGQIWRNFNTLTKIEKSLAHFEVFLF